mmetsp:Transcript_66651/g.77357  ORF Transcript_66651/g.77357 Transcript_66651/m.77357 type:complete len:88 (+) Transcript_66651:268-531(+)
MGEKNGLHTTSRDIEDQWGIASKGEEPGQISKSATLAARLDDGWGSCGSLESTVRVSNSTSADAHEGLVSNIVNGEESLVIGLGINA